MLYFAYGSNLDRRQFARRCPGSRPVAPATLRGYHLAFRGGGHADIIREKGGAVRGALYRVTARDVEALDRYEGLPGYYHRITVFVRDDRRQLRRAFAYKMGNGFGETAPALSYVQIILRGCRDWGIEPDAELEAALKTRESAERGL